MNITLYPRWWFGFHLITTRGFYVTLVLGWYWRRRARYRRWHYCRGFIEGTP